VHSLPRAGSLVPQHFFQSVRSRPDPTRSGKLVSFASNPNSDVSHPPVFFRSACSRPASRQIVRLRRGNGFFSSANKQSAKILPRSRVAPRVDPAGTLVVSDDSICKNPPHTTPPSGPSCRSTGPKPGIVAAQKIRLLFRLAGSSPPPQNESTVHPACHHVADETVAAKFPPETVPHNTTRSPRWRSIHGCARQIIGGVNPARRAVCRNSDNKPLAIN